MNEKRPTDKYQCVSRPGECKFEWCCSPLCACVIKIQARTAQEKRDTKVARNRQYRWGIKHGYRKPRRRVTIEGRRAEAALCEDARRRGY